MKTLNASNWLLLTLICTILGCGSMRETRIVKEGASNPAECPYEARDLSFQITKSCSFLLSFCKATFTVTGTIFQAKSQCEYAGMTVKVIGERPLSDAEINGMFRVMDFLEPQSPSERQTMTANFRQEVSVQLIELKPVFKIRTDSTPDYYAKNGITFFDIDYIEERNDPWTRNAAEVKLGNLRRFSAYGTGK